jgi:hypothetical protein
MPFGRGLAAWPAIEFIIPGCNVLGWSNKKYKEAHVVVIKKLDIWAKFD